MSSPTARPSCRSARRPCPSPEAARPLPFRNFLARSVGFSSLCAILGSGARKEAAPALPRTGRRSRSWLAGPLYSSAPRRASSSPKAMRAARTGSCADPTARHWPMNHVIADPKTGTIYGARRRRVVRPRRLEIHRSRRDLDPFERGPRLCCRRGADQGGVEPRPARRQRSMPGVQPAGIFRSDDGGSDLAPYRRTAEAPVAAGLAAGGAGLILHSIVVAPRGTTSASGSASRPPASSTPATAARPGSRATGARGPTSCRRTSDIPSSASACTAS